MGYILSNTSVESDNINFTKTKVYFALKKMKLDKAELRLVMGNELDCQESE